MKEFYDSDISREQFEIIREELEQARKTTRPRKTDLYGIFCAILYLLKTGCQWRMLPINFPNWKLVYYYFSVWKERKKNQSESVFDKVLKKISSKTPKQR
jgi:transposase